MKILIMFLLSFSLWGMTAKKAEEISIKVKKDIISQMKESCLQDLKNKINEAANLGDYKKCYDISGEYLTYHTRVEGFSKYKAEKIHGPMVCEAFEGVEDHIKNWLTEKGYDFYMNDSNANYFGTYSGDYCIEGVKK